jgi:hypothetical protein
MSMVNENRRQIGIDLRKPAPRRFALQVQHENYDTAFAGRVWGRTKLDMI